MPAVSLVHKTKQNPIHFFDSKMIDETNLFFSGHEGFKLLYAPSGV